MVIFSYLWFIFRDFPLTCISEGLNRYLSNLFMIRMKTRSCRFVKVTEEVLLLKMSAGHYRSLGRETLTLATVSICCICWERKAIYTWKNVVHCGGHAASLLLWGCPVPAEDGDRRIWVMELLWTPDLLPLGWLERKPPQRAVLEHDNWILTGCFLAPSAL